jgi:hypothetical protein
VPAALLAAAAAAGGGPTPDLMYHLRTTLNDLLSEPQGALHKQVNWRGLGGSGLGFGLSTQPQTTVGGRRDGGGVSVQNIWYPALTP